MNTRLLLATLSSVAVLTGLSAGSASAASNAQQEAVSQNWAGYVVGDSTTGSGFSSVSGSWVQPSVKCDSGGQDYSAFWVGLGGSSEGSQALEQVGTQSDCTSGAGTDYYAWYELVPAAPVQLGLAIHPGDHISAKVNVSGTNVTVALSDQTTGQSSTKTLQMSDPDTSSAEWIAEAPSACDESGNCQPLALSDFGTVDFTGASATSGGHTGAISDSDWTAQPVELGSSGAEDTSFAADQSSAGATPSTLSTDGSSFSVAWQQSAGDSSASQTGGASGGSGDNGYGNGGYGDGGYPGGYGANGYGGYPGGSGGYGYGGYGYGGYGSGGYGGGGYGGAGYGSGGYGYGYGAF
jgi:hypothetical protein